jgi:flagellar basal body rod protein FlgG
MACEIHEGDIGTTLTVTVTDCGTTLDISTATSLSIFIKKPDGTLLTRTGIFTTDGTDGKIYYVTVAGDTDVAGTYKIQGRVTFPSTASYYTSSATFHVECNL